MARLHEHQAKNLLQEYSITVPNGHLAHNPEEVYQAAVQLESAVVLKVQAWTTGRAAIGGIKFAETPDEAASLAKRMFRKKIGNFTVDTLLVEQRLDIAEEFFAGVIIDDQAKQPVMIFSSMGGSGIEEIAREHPDKVTRTYFDVVEGLKDYQARDLIRRTGISGKLQMKLGALLVNLSRVALKYEARSAEINPIVLTADQLLFAADCRITIDDYAVFRHPELKIKVAREFNRPPTPLDLIAYNVEKGDYRGTFYFIQMEQGFHKGERYVGFHGAGGGGSMMSMDAVANRGYTIANFCDTSGNPPASKVYRAARIILSQPGIDGYFGSGSGVASQEQFHSARGLVKAFREEQLKIPAVIRLGGNSEDKAVEILETFTTDLPARVKGFKKDDSVEYCAEQFDELVKQHQNGQQIKTDFHPPVAKKPYIFETVTGSVRFDHAICAECDAKICINNCVQNILQLEDGVPALKIPKEEAKKGRCSECLACEVDCAYYGSGGGYVHLPVEGLDDYRRRTVESKA